MKTIINNLYDFFVKPFHKIGSDEITSVEGAIALTSGTITTSMLMICNLLSNYLFKFSLIKDMDEWFFLSLLFLFLTIFSRLTRKIVKNRKHKK